MMEDGILTIILLIIIMLIVNSVFIGDFGISFLEQDIVIKNSEINIFLHGKEKTTKIIMKIIMKFRKIKNNNDILF